MRTEGNNLITKKTVVSGMSVKQTFTDPLSFLHDFFQTKPVEAKVIRHGTPEERIHVKKRVIESRATRWGAPQQIKEKRVRR